MTQKQTESPYKALGTNANISDKRIKEKYIQAVKKHPPETDPEGFERVRRAYETLKTPEKRQQFDLLRKYGGSIDDLLEKASAAMERNSLVKAENSLKIALKAAPKNVHVYLSSMHLASLKEDLDELEAAFNKGIAAIDNQEDLISLYKKKVQELFDRNLLDKTVQTLEEANKQFPYSHGFALDLAGLYVEMEHLDKGWEMINNAIPLPGRETVQDLHSFLAWTIIMDQTGHWEAVGKVKSRFRKFIKNISSEDDQEMVIEGLYSRFMEMYWDEESPRLAELYGEILKGLNKKISVKIKEPLAEVKEMARVTAQLDKIMKDDDMFPLVQVHAVFLVRGEIYAEEQVAIQMGMPPDLYLDLAGDKEAYAAGIIRLQTRYSLLYKTYKEDWDELFAELTKGFNREMRRELRKIK